MSSELVKRLSKGKHEVIIVTRNESYEEVKQRIENGYIHIKFIKTRGGTELGINIDLNNTNIKGLKSNDNNGLFHIEGVTNLNYIAVRCVANIDLVTRKGEGYLQIIEEED